MSKRCRGGRSRLSGNIGEAVSSPDATPLVFDEDKQWLFLGDELQRHGDYRPAKISLRNISAKLFFPDMAAIRLSIKKDYTHQDGFVQLNRAPVHCYYRFLTSPPSVIMYASTVPLV